MHCPWCGHQLRQETARFCGSCGRALPAPPVESGSSARPSEPSPYEQQRVAGKRTEPPSHPPKGEHSVAAAGSIVLAVVFHALLVDAAVEAYLDNSPFRLWIAGTVIAYFLLNLLAWRTANRLWRHFSWARMAESALLVLLGMLAFTAWRTSGHGGLELLRQPAPIVLAAVTAIAIAFSGFVVARVTFIPKVFAAAGLLLACYGVVAFIVAIKQGTSYPDLFHGLSLWHQLPMLLQGAVIGSFAIVPLALIAMVAAAAIRRAGAGSRFSASLHSLGLMLILVIAVAGLSPVPTG